MDENKRSDETKRCWARRRLTNFFAFRITKVSFYQFVKYGTKIGLLWICLRDFFSWKNLEGEHIYSKMVLANKNILRDKGCPFCKKNVLPNATDDFCSRRVQKKFFERERRRKKMNWVLGFVPDACKLRQTETDTPILLDWGALLPRKLGQKVRFFKGIFALKEKP